MAEKNIRTEYERAWEKDYFLRRVLTVAAIVVALVVILASIVLTFNVLLLIFTGILSAIFLVGLRDYLARVSRMNKHVALALVVGTLVIVLGGATVLIGPQMVNQLGQLNERIPKAEFQLRKDLKQHALGRDILRYVPSRVQIGNMLFDGGERSFYTQITGVFSTTLGILTNLVVVGFIGLYLAMEPERYVNGMLSLVPQHRQVRAKEVLDAIGTTIYMWLLSRSISMILVGVSTTVGLVIIGVPLALTLGILAGLLSFIPTFGPIIALVPAMLLGLVESPRTAVYVLLLYFGIQQVENYLITPLIERRTTNLPPALTLGAQLVAGVVFGFLGLVLAAPMVIIVVRAVRMLYIEDILGQDQGKTQQDVEAAKG